MVKKKNNSRFFVLVMSFLLAFQMLSATVFAINNTDRGMLTVENIEAGVTVNAYQLMEINYDYNVDQPINPMYVWQEGVADWIKENYSDFIQEDNLNEVTEDFSSANEAVIAELYDKLAVAIKDRTVTLPVTEKISEGTSIVIDNLEMGNYFVLIEGGLKVYRPLSANIVPEWSEDAWVMTSPVVSAKSSEPSITKTITGDIKTDNAAIGDTIGFELKAVIPSYPENAKAKKYMISDQLSTGLTLVEDSLKVYGVCDGKEDVLLTEGITVETNEDDFSLDFDYTKIKNYESVKVTYNTVLNERAAVGEAGNKNSALLTYNNNPYVETDFGTDEDYSNVLTYGLEITKVDEDTENGLAGAEFTLKKDGSDIWFTGSEGKYHTSVTEGTGETIVKVDANGKLVLDGLDAGTYELIEVKAPEGYVKLQNEIEVVIEDKDMNGKVEAGQQELDNGYMVVTVKNDKGFTLPVTGGMGTTLFSVVGILLMGGGLISIVSFHNKRRKTK